MEFHHRRRFIAFVLTLVLIVIESGYCFIQRSDAAWCGVVQQQRLPTTTTTTFRDSHRYSTKRTIRYLQVHRQSQEVNHRFGCNNVQCAAAASSTTTTESSHTEMKQQQQDNEVEVNIDDGSDTTSNLTTLSSSMSTSAVTIPMQTTILSTTHNDDLMDDQQQQQQQLENDRITVLVLLWCIAAISALDRVAMSVALVPMSYEYSPMITDTMKGLISSLFSIGYGFAIIPAGLFISCISPKTLMTLGILIWSLATILTPTSAEFITMTTLPILCIRSIVGMGEAILIPTVHRLLSVWTTNEQKSSALAFIFSGFHAGTIGAYLLSPYIMDVWTNNHDYINNNDWRILFYVYGTFGLFLLIPWLRYAKDEPTAVTTTALAISAAKMENDPTTLQTTSIRIDDSTATTITATSSSSWDEALQSYRNAPWKQFLKSRGVWGMLFAHCAKNWGLYTSLSWIPTYYAEQYHIGVRDSAWLSVLPSIAGALGGFIAGTLADNTMKNMSASMSDETTTLIRKMFQAVGLLGPAMALAALAYQSPDEAWVAQLYLMVAVGLQSFNAGGFEAGTQDKAGPRWIGMLYSVTSLPSVMVGTFGVYVTGVVLDLSHQDWSIVWYMNAVVNVLGAIAFIGLYDSKREFE